MLAEILHPVAMMDQKTNDTPYGPRPSLAGPERCIRQMVYWGLGIEKTPLPGRTFHIFSDSSWHEELTADWIRKTAFRLHSEQMHIDVAAGLSFLPQRQCKICGHIIPPEHLAGHIDGLLTDILNIDREWENKAINHFSFMRYWNGELPLDNLAQTCIYLRGLQDINPEIQQAILLMKNKNTSAYLEFLVDYDRGADTATIRSRTNSQGETIEMNEVISGICSDSFSKFQLVHDYTEKQTLPKRAYEMDHWRCEYCQWGETCWAGYREEFGQLKTDQILPNEMADIVRYQKELGGQMGDIKKERDGLTSQIKAVMKEMDTKEGHAGEYICKLSLSELTNLDKSKIPSKILEQAETKKMVTRLTISKLSSKENGGK